MRLGLSSYAFVWAAGVPGYPQPPRPLNAEDLLDKALELGVRVVQIADNLPLDRLSDSALASLAQRANRVQIDLEVGTCGIEPQHLHNYLAIATRLGSPLLRIVLDTDAVQPSPQEAIALLREVLPAFRRAGVCLAIENHDRFPAAVLAEIVECSGSDGLGICLDTANSLGCGEDVHSVLRALGPWVVNVHIKDFLPRRLPHKKGFTIEGCAAGQGALDIPRLLAELRAFHRDPNCILELWPAPEATNEASIAKEDAQARKSIAYLRQYIPH